MMKAGEILVKIKKLKNLIQIICETMILGEYLMDLKIKRIQKILIIIKLKIVIMDGKVSSY